LLGAVISMLIGLPRRLKSITKPGAAFAVRWLLSAGWAWQVKIGCEGAAMTKGDFQI
jgi:hypothetical protein